MFYINNSFHFLLDKDASQVLEAVRSSGVVITQAHRNYVHFVISSAKSLGVWDNMIAFYGLVGGTAASHKWNWKDLRDLDVAYRLTLPNGATHSELGMVGNGTNQYGETFVSSSIINSTNFGITAQFNTTTTVNCVDLGIIKNSGTGAGVFELLSGSGIQQIAIGNATTYYALIQPLVKGIVTGQLNGTLLSFINNGKVTIETPNISFVPAVPDNFEIMVRRDTNTSIFNYYSTKRYTCLAIHSHLTNISNFQLDMNIAQSILGRL